MTTPRAAVVILAAGSGLRLGGEKNKVLLPLDGIPVLVHTMRQVTQVAGCNRLVLVVRAVDRRRIAETVSAYFDGQEVWLVQGGAERHDSEWCAVQALREDIEADAIEVVAIHDAARPLAPAELFRRVIDAAFVSGGAIPVVPAGRLSHADGSLAPTGLVGVQTPQAFSARGLMAAYVRAHAEGFRGTDTAACLARYTDIRVTGVASGPENVKVTYPEDLVLAEQLLSRRQR